LIESIADVAASIKYEIEKNGNLGNFEESLKILNSVSNHMGLLLLSAKRMITSFLSKAKIVFYIK
jgi:hypothetical protein